MRTVEVTPSRRQPPRQRPSIRVRPAPPSDPPYDDEGEAWAGAYLAGRLALPWSRTPDEAGAVPAAGSSAGSVGHDTSGPHRAPAPCPTGPASPPPVVAGPSAQARQAVRRFVAVLVEVLNGYRPPAHLRPLCRPVEAAEIIAQARAAIHRMAEARRAPSRPPGSGPRPSAPAATRTVHRTADRHGRRPDSAAVLRLRLCEPRPGSVEATVVLVTGARTWALALRLEGGPDAWAATVARIL